MSAINKPRGTVDLFGNEMELFQKIAYELKTISKLFNFSEIATPIFEHKELFVRNIGESSDIVTKEFYDFKDKSHRDLVLRPENTVAVIRAVIENKLLHTNPLPLRYFYLGPMFRYERPQSGRYRQFHQYGIEVIGVKNAFQDVETIIFANTILKRLNITQYKLKINYIGGFATRTKWIEALKKYFLPYQEMLTEDSKKRLSTNPLRIIDDKVDGSKEFVKKAPKVEEFFIDEEINEWNKIKEILQQTKIKYELDTTLVRGLDYYNGIVFEFVSTSSKLQGQATIIGGGKYSNLTKELGSDNYDCIGFAIGIERIMIAYKEENKIDNLSNLDLYVATLKLSDKDKQKIFALINDLRMNEVASQYNFSLEKIDKQFKYAEKLNPKFIAIIGDKEIINNIVVIKDQRTKQEIKLSFNNFINEFKNILKNKE